MRTINMKYRNAHSIHHQWNLIFAVSTMSNVSTTSNSQQPMVLSHIELGYTPIIKVILTEHKLANQSPLCEYVKWVNKPGNQSRQCYNVILSTQYRQENTPVHIYSNHIVECGIHFCSRSVWLLRGTREQERCL